MSMTIYPVVQWEQDGLAILSDTTLSAVEKLWRLRHLAETTIASPFPCAQPGCQEDAAYCWAHGGPPVECASCGDDIEKPYCRACWPDTA